MHDGDPVPDRCVVQEVAGRKVVGAVDDHVPALAEDAVDVLGGQALLEREHADVRVERLERPSCRLDLRLAEPVGRMDDLALQVRLVDDVRVDDPERADARRREIERRGGAEPAGADEEDARIEQALLPVLADLGDEEMPAVARALLGREGARDRDLEPVPLPLREAAGEVDDVLVAQFGERLGRESGARPGGAVDDEGVPLVGYEALDALLEPPAARVDRTGDVAFVPLVRLADVDEERCVRAGMPLLRFDGRDLVDLVLHAREELSVASHYFPNYSGVVRGYRRRVTARTRIIGLVALASAAAVAIVAVAVVSAGGDSSEPAAEAKPRPGRPPLSLSLGFRGDAEARDLKQGAALYGRGDAHAAGMLFARHDSLEAKVGLALTAWPEGYDRLEQLAKLYPESGVVQLHLGLARLWAGRGDPVAAWQAVADVEPDSPYAVLAGNLLFPRLPRGLPTFVPSFSAPSAITDLPAARQLGALRDRAERGGVRDRLLYGVGLQRVGRPVSARSAFAEAARVAPRNAEANVAAAVGRFDKARPVDAFSRLGPLTRRFPREPTVRFHLGVLLLWTGRVDEAERQLRLASGIRPGSPLAREAERYLETIRRARGSGG